ncbi:MAG: insulinase family protein [Chloroflexi bacterium]|nr:insulinase family protein [Chloroflexota bacterium]
MATSPIQEHRLGNGLTVLTREVRSAPVVSFSVWYRVGSRDEVPGITGISHWAEHMAFKGTERFAKGEADKLVAAHGGVFNGMTWIDYTAYYETLPSEHARLAVQIESDRMASALFDPAEVDSERGVIISEREGGENEPGFFLGEEITAAAFKLHPYGQPVVGFKSDLRRITRQNLWNHYRRYYAPNNAVVIAVGDFDTPALLELVEDEFGKIKRRATAPRLPLVEPSQEGERRVVVERPGAVQLLSMAYHVPEGSHPDTMPLDVLSGVLSAGRSSRLYKALVIGGLASSASAGLPLTREPYLFRISATARPGVEVTRIEEVVDAELRRLVEEGVGEPEMAKVRRQLRSGHLFSTEGVTNQMRYLGQYAMAGSWRGFESYLDDVPKVTGEDVVRVAATYLTERNRTVGWFLPSNAVGDGARARLAVAARAAATAVAKAERPRHDRSRVTAAGGAA